VVGHRFVRGYDFVAHALGKVDIREAIAVGVPEFTQIEPKFQTSVTVRCARLSTSYGQPGLMFPWACLGVGVRSTSGLPVIRDQSPGYSKYPALKNLPDFFMLTGWVYAISQPGIQKGNRGLDVH
jgi:hypothetical protein